MQNPIPPPPAPPLPFNPLPPIPHFPNSTISQIVPTQSDVGPIQPPQPTPDPMRGEGDTIVSHNTSLKCLMHYKSDNTHKYMS